MNYDQKITALITAIKEDKSITQPWKNYATKELNIAQACLRMSKTSTNLKPPSGLVNDDGSLAECTCPRGAVDTSCPQHGSSV